MQPFQIKIEQSGNVTYRLNVERRIANPDLERYELRAKNHTFLMDVNRPAMVASGTPHLPWTWRLVGGKCPLWFHNEMQKALEKYLRDEMYAGRI